VSDAGSAAGGGRRSLAGHRREPQARRRKQTFSRWANPFAGLAKSPPAVQPAGPPVDQPVALRSGFRVWRQLGQDRAAPRAAAGPTIHNLHKGRQRFHPHLGATRIGGSAPRVGGTKGIGRCRQMRA